MSTATRRSRWLIAPLAVLLTACGADLHVSVPATSVSTSSSSPSSSSSSTSSTPSSTPLPTATQIVQQVTGNFDKAKSAHVVADHTETGKHESIEISGTLDGTNQSAKFTIQPEQAVAQFLVVSARVYVNGNEAYYRKSGATDSRAKELAGRWVSIPVSSVHDYTDITIGGMLKDLRTELQDEAEDDLQVSADSDNGQSVWKLTNDDTTVIVLADGSGRLVRAEHTNSSGEKETYAFDQWDAAPTVDAPSNPITT